jgi:hypothetical protein
MLNGYCLDIFPVVGCVLSGVTVPKSLFQDMK